MILSDINECVEEEGFVCNGEHQGCTDDDGGYTCYCTVGYEWNDASAKDFCKGI